MEQKLIPFDLERALAGDPVQTRGGIRAEQLFHFDKVICEDERVAAVIEGVLQTYYENGKMFETKESPLDLFMAPKVREYWVNVYRNTSGTLELGAEFDKEDLAYNEIPKRTKFLMKHIATIKLTEQI